MNPKPGEPIIDPDKLKRARRRVHKVFHETWEEYHRYKPDDSSDTAILRKPLSNASANTPAKIRALERARILAEPPSPTDESGYNLNVAADPGPSSTRHTRGLNTDATATEVCDSRAIPLEKPARSWGGPTSLSKDKQLKEISIATHSPNAPPKYDWCTYSNISVTRHYELTLPFIPFGWEEKLLQEHINTFKKHLDGNSLLMSWMAAYRRPACE